MKHCLEISHFMLLCYMFFLGQVIGEMGLHCDMEMIPVKTYVFLFYAKV